MMWINEIEPSKSVVDMKTSCSIGTSLQTNSEVLDSEVASGLKKKINGDKRNLHSRRVSRGRQATCIIYAYFNVSDTDDSVVELDEILKVELKKEHVQSFNTRWDKIAIITGKRLYAGIRKRKRKGLATAQLSRTDFL